MYHNVLKVAGNSSFCGSIRSISTSLTHRRNLRHLEWDKYGNTKLQEWRKTTKDPLFAYQDYGDRKPGIVKEDGTLEVIPEMIPDIIVPDLTGFTLKPYVSYRAPDVKREEFTPKALFDSVYKSKIVQDFANNALSEDGKPTSPSQEESMTGDEALARARQTGADIFAEVPEHPDQVEYTYWRK